MPRVFGRQLHAARWSIVIAVGIDPSLTSTGVAVLVDGRLRHFGRYGRDGHNGASWASRSNRVRQSRSMVYRAAVTCGRPDCVVIEGHPYAVGNQGNEFDRAGLWHLIFEAFAARDIPVVVVDNKKAKAWVTGAGNASKPDMMAVIDAWYLGQIEPPLSKWRKKDNPDDVADAIAYATMAAFKLGDPIPFEPKERHRTSLQLLAWPAMEGGR
jgi:crossover junction endodeoxyribonuclease RuvC